MSNKCVIPNCKNTVVGVPFPKDKQVWLNTSELQVDPHSDKLLCVDHFHHGCVLNSKDLDGTKSIQRKYVTHMIKNALRKNQIDEGENKICRVCMSENELENSIFELLEDEVTIMSTLMLCAYPLYISKDDKLPKYICLKCLNTLKVAHEFRKTCLNTDKILHERIKLSKKRRISINNEEKVSKRSKVFSISIPQSTFPESSDSQIVKSSLDSTSSIDSFNLTEDDNNSFEVLYEDLEENIVDGNILSEENRNTDPLEFTLLRNIQVKTERKTCVDSQSEEDENSVEEVNNDLQKKKIHSITVATNLGDDDGTFTPIKLQKQSLDDIERKMELIHGRKEHTVAQDYSSSTIQEITSILTSGDFSKESTKKVVTPKKQDYSIRVKTEQHQQEHHQQPQQPHPKKKIVVKTLAKFGKESLLNEVKLPKDIKIKPVEKYESATGRFHCTVREGLYDSVFVIADNYVYENGLTKNNIKHLKCIVSNCGSKAEQKIIGEDIESYLTVKIPHNHLAPNEATKKKQMFLWILKRKIQTDKFPNIKNIHEDACVRDPEIRSLVPLRYAINEICRHQLSQKTPVISSFENFYNHIEHDLFRKLHFTHNNQQFYQEKFRTEDGAMAVVFGNIEIMQQLSDSKIMYVDASFKIETNEDFKYQLVTVLVWVDDSYYPILFALINKKSQEIFKSIFSCLYSVLAPSLRPDEIITDYEANLYYALAEVYVESNIGGSVFYYTQNLYKKVCSLNLSRDLETNSFFRNIYHMLLMLPLLPVNTILDGLNNIELEAKYMNITELSRPLFDHIRSQWISNVTPDLFCVHKLENRINENVIAPFKKLRDFLLLTKGKMQKTQATITHVIEKLIDLDEFLRFTYSKQDKKSFGRDLSSFQKKNVLRAWQYIEDHPKIEINNFFGKVLGYIKCMENQLWIWGFYRYAGDTDDILINASHFSIVGPTEESEEEEVIELDEEAVVMEAVVDNDGVLQTGGNDDGEASKEINDPNKHFETAFLKYVYKT